MKGKLTGRGVLAWLICFFGVILATNVVFIVISARTFRGEDEQKPYLQGVEFNDTLARRAEQMAQGWQAQVSADRERDGQITLLVRVDDRDRTAKSGLNLIGELRHPADENRDHVLRFVAAGAGLYRAQARGVTPGAWNLLLHTASGAPFEVDQRLWLR